MNDILRRVRRFLLPPADLEPQQGIFLVLCRGGAVLSLGVVIPVNLFQDLPRVINVLVGVFGLFCIWLHREAIRGRYHMVQLMVALQVLLNLTYFPNAGSRGSITFYSFPLILLPLVFQRGRARYVGVMLVTLNWTLLLLLEALMPGLVTPFNSETDRLLDLWTGWIVSGMAAVVITTVVLSWYHGEQARLRATVLELDASREQLAELFRQHSDAVLVIDAETRKVVQVNDTFTRLSGLRAEDMVGRTTSELNLWRDPADRERFYQLLLADGRVRDFVAEFQSITGVRQWGSVSSGFVTIGGRRQLLTTARDITAEQAAAAAAAESSALVQAMINSSDEIVSVVDPVTHRVLLYNQTTETYFQVLLRPADADWGASGGAAARRRCGEVARDVHARPRVRAVHRRLHHRVRARPAALVQSGDAPGQGLGHFDVRPRHHGVPPCRANAVAPGAGTDSGTEGWRAWEGSPVAWRTTSTTCSTASWGTPS